MVHCLRHRGEWLAEQQIKKSLDNGEIDKADVILKKLVRDACANAMEREKAGGSVERKYIGTTKLQI